MALVASVFVVPAPRPALAELSSGITKSLDATQGPGYLGLIDDGQGGTLPGFVNGSAVDYRLTAQCSSLTGDCGIATVTDVLDPHIDFTGLILPVQSPPPPDVAIPISYTYVAHTLAITIGSATVPFRGGTTLEFVLVAKTNAPLGGVFPNTAHITDTTSPGDVKDSQTVTIKVPSPVPDWELRKTKVAPISNPALDSDVTYKLQFWAPTYYGNVNIASGTLVDTLPPGATYVSSVPAGTVGTDANGNTTVTWTVGPTSPIVAGCVDQTLLHNCPSQNSWLVTVHYPSPTFKVGDQPINYGDAAVTYADDSTESLSANAQITFVNPDYSTYFAKTGPATTATGSTVQWRLRAINNGNVTWQNATMTDTLPTSGVSNLELFRRYSLLQPVTSPLSASFQRYDTTTNGWVSWFNWDSTQTWTTTPVPANTSAFRYSVASLAPDQGLDIYVQGTVTGDTDTSFTNCASLTADNVPAANLPQQSCVTTTVQPPRSEFMVYKAPIYPDAGVASVAPGQTFRWGILVKPFGPSPVTTIDLADVLPPQFEYVSTDCWAMIPGDPYSEAVNSPWYCANTTQHTAVAPQPTTVTIDAGGSTTLFWNDLPAAPTGGPYLFGTDQGYVMLITVRAKEGTAVANYTNNAYVRTDEVPNVCYSQGWGVTSVADTTDLDGDGNTTEQFCHNQATAQVRQAAIAEIFKWVKGNLDTNVAESTGLADPTCPDWDGYTRYPCVAELSPKGPFDYRFRMVNTGNINLSKYTVYDILPHPADTGVNQATAGQQRGSDWTPVMTGPLTFEGALPVGAAPKVMYNLSYDPCRPELSEPTPGVVWQTGCDDTWYTADQITDWSTVKSFRIQMFFSSDPDQPAVWPPATQIVAHVPMQAPANAPVSVQNPLDLSVAWNSVSHQVYRLNSDNTTEWLPAAAPRKVGVIVPFDLVRLGNQLWFDTGAGAHTNNGVYDSGEKPVVGATVQLFTDDGDGVFDPTTDTPAGTTTTDSSGNYNFLVSPDTKYFVVIPAGQAVLDGYVSSSGQSTDFTIAGDNADHGAPTSGYVAVSTVVSVSADGAPVGETDTNDTTSADSEADTATGTTVADNSSNMTVDFGFVPNVVSLGDLVWLDSNRDGAFDNGESGIANVKVELLDSSGAQATDAAGNPVDAVYTDGDGRYEFDNLLPGEYQVRFTRPTGYLWTTSNAGGVSDGLDSDPLYTAVNDATATTATFTLSAAPVTDDDLNAEHRSVTNPTIDAGVVPALSLGDLVWIDANRDGLFQQTEAPIANVKVELLDASGHAVTDADGATVLSTTTDGFGRYEFTNLLPGDYTVRFTRPSGYLWTTSNVASGDDGLDSDPSYVSNVDATATTATVTLTSTPVADTDTNAHVMLVTNPTIDAGVIPVAYDLALIKTVGAGPFVYGSTVVWTITVANQGNVASKAFTVTDTLPGGITFVSASDGGTVAAGVVTWQIADLAIGATKSLTLTTKITDATLRPFRNWAEISADSSSTYGTGVHDKDSTPDTNTGSDSGAGVGVPPNDAVVNHNDITQDSVPGDEDDNDYEDVTVPVVYDLALVKVVTTAGPVAPGDDVTWWISVKNQGNVPSGPITITDTLPSGVTFVSAPDGGVNSGRTVTWNYPNMEPGDVLNLVVHTTVKADATGTLRNWAEISHDSSATYGTGVHDKDSTPDTNTGSDQTLPNDSYVGIDDLNQVSVDQVPGDEDDNDDAVITVKPTSTSTSSTVPPTSVVGTTIPLATTTTIVDSGAGLPTTSVDHGSSSLPVTGGDPAGIVWLAALMIVGGVTGTAITRRRRHG